MRQARIRHAPAISLLGALLLSCTAGPRDATHGAGTARGADSPPAAAPAGTPDADALVELYTVRSADGAVTAHFMGKHPDTAPGEPVPPLSFGVQRLDISFRGEARRRAFRPAGTLFFSDWSFEIFSPMGTYAALPQDRFGPYHIVATSRLAAYLEGSAQPDDVVAYWPQENGFRPVHGNLRWVSDTELEHEAQGETTIVLRHRVGGSSEIVDRHAPGEDRAVDGSPASSP